VTPGATEVFHVLIAAALTYVLGFERDLRGAPAGDRVFSLIGVGAGIVGVFAVHGAPNALQGALTGIGFIGGGVVFRQEQGQLGRPGTPAATRPESAVRPPALPGRHQARLVQRRAHHRRHPAGPG
jgi:hypothetical protein